MEADVKCVREQDALALHELMEDKHHYSFIA